MALQGDRVFWISSIGNLVAAYNLSITGHVLVLVGASGTRLSASEEGIVASSVIIGAVVGQFGFGYAGQRILSLQIGLALSLALCSIGNIAAAFLCWQPVLFPMLVAFRFLSGLGAGGVYPLSAVASAETAQEPKERGSRMMLVFSMQGVGQILAPLFIVILDAILPQAPSASWRIALILGTIPSAFGARLALRSSGYERNDQTIDEMPPNGENLDQEPVEINAEHTMITTRDPTVWTPRNIFLLVGKY